jgi:hypothetical protein
MSIGWPTRHWGGAPSIPLLDLALDDCFAGGGYEVRVARERAFCPLSQIDIVRTADPAVHESQICAITPSANAAVIAAARTVRFIHASSRSTSPRANAPFESPR